MTVNTKKANWDKENMRTVSCRLRKEDAEKFREYAEYNGTTSHALLAKFVHACIGSLKNTTAEERANVEALREQTEVLRKKLAAARAELAATRTRASNAEAIVDEYLRSADEK